MKKTVFLIMLVCVLCFPQLTKAVTKKAFDFVVGVDGDFKAACARASQAASEGNRFYIFFPNGEYDIGSLTGNENQMTVFSTSNVSFIGESADKTVIFNRSVNEGISITSTLHFKKADNLYIQDLSILNKANFNQPSTYSVTGRHVAVMEQGKKIIYKNVKLLSTQDTYYTKGERTYLENCEIHGTTDFICGSGDVFFNGCLLYVNKVSYITAPATSSSWGYVFYNCTIDGSVNSYQLGRAWNGTPKCVYINTTMKVLPTASAWGDPMNVVPSLFAEYNSRKADGSPVDLSSRRRSYSKNGVTANINPVLTQAQASEYTISNVLKGSDNWKPDELARQADAPEVFSEGLAVKWENDENVLCWAVFKNDKFLKCVTAPSCEVDISDTGSSYYVRAANLMGGLGEKSNTLKFSFVHQYALQTSVASGEGTVAPENGTFTDGQEVTLTAVPEKGWVFSNWSGDISGDLNPVTVTMTSDKSISAVFVPSISARKNTVFYGRNSHDGLKRTVVEIYTINGKKVACKESQLRSINYDIETALKGLTRGVYLIKTDFNKKPEKIIRN
ncbi:MAG: pectinesterase family protein [Fibrobacter sp.]|nr:pectinesterase family protein [Fibrobacter sp.]